MFESSIKIPAFVFLVLLGGAGCSHVIPVYRGAGPIIRTMEAEGISGPRLFELSRVWLVRNLNSEKGIIEYENPAERTLIANGTVGYPATGLEAIEKIQYTISFQVRVQIAPGKITLTFENMMIDVPKVYNHRAETWFGREYFGGYSRPPLDAEEYAAALRAVSTVSEAFSHFIENQKKSMMGKDVQGRGADERERAQAVME